MRTNLKFVNITNPTYLACIMWKDSLGLVYRYMLWDSIGESKPLGYPLYSGQLIMRNFRIEIWDINGNDITQSTAENIITSVLKGQDYRWTTDSALAGNDGQVTNFACNTVVTDTYQQFDSLQARWLGSTAVVSSPWTSSDGNNFQFSPPLFTINNDGTIATEPVAHATRLEATPINLNPVHMFIVCNISAVGDAGGNLYYFIGSPVMSATIMEGPPNVLTITLEDGNSCVTTKNTWIVLEVAYGTGTSAIRATPLFNLGIYTPPIFTVSTTVPPTYHNIILNNDFNTSTLVADIEIFNVYLGAVDSQTMMTYFNNRYNFIFPLPLVFPANSSSQPN